MHIMFGEIISIYLYFLFDIDKMYLHDVFIKIKIICFFFVTKKTSKIKKK